MLHLTATFNNDALEPKIGFIATNVVPFLAKYDPSELVITQMSGGISNFLFKAEASDEHPVLVRIYGKNTDQIIDRENELKTIAALAEQNLAKPIYGEWELGDLKGCVYGWTYGVQIQTEEMKDRSVMDMIAKYMAKFNSLNPEGTGLSTSPAAFAAIRKWANCCEGIQLDEKCLNAVGVGSDPVSWILQEADMLEGTFNNLNAPIVFCHNDLLAGNILILDGQKEVSFIDHEYGHFNYRGFEIGNHWAEMCGDFQDQSMYPDEDQQSYFIQRYLYYFNNDKEASYEEIANLIKEANAYAVVSLLHWGTWGIFQECNSKIEFNFVNFVAGRFSHYKTLKEKVFEKYDF
eukprot:TRINITY_DN12509_c0_g1_i1.p1 TRINITY_DN12509_c0_g1~~TRINITY_DN12509_c0_g1_i1.p1  ORF type:complete len:348 (+),score=80.42 TRINITY_DN12509_c0_g1_i1:79-1122(+)